MDEANRSIDRNGIMSGTSGTAPATTTDCWLLVWDSVPFRIAGKLILRHLADAERRVVHD